jgi:hypothetical protein
VHQEMSPVDETSRESLESSRPEDGDSNNHSEVAARAYQLWQERGCPIGSDQEDWFRAEAQLKSSRCSTAIAA